jgi:hypothetical protein
MVSPNDIDRPTPDEVPQPFESTQSTQPVEQTQQLQPIEPSPSAQAPQPPRPSGARGWLGSLTGFQRGLLVGLATAAVVGIAAWAASGDGGGSKQPSGTGPAANPTFEFPSPGQAGTPEASPTKKKGKGSATGIPVPDYTPGGAQPALVAAASLPGVTSANPAVTCPAATVTVSSADQLQSALSAAAPGTAIQLADGTYTGNFAATAVGTAAQPIFLCGGGNAVLDGGGKGGYVFHLNNTAYWRLVGFTVQNGQKGVVLDHTDYSVVQGLTVQHVGDEAIHLREFSDDDLVLNNTVHDTGSRNPKYGEGVYIGTAQSNWCTYTACQQDHSDNDVVRGNRISATTAESVDIKEGTTGGAVIGNTFDGAAFSPKGASGWVNAKGNNYLIKGNTGRNSYQDGFQTHQILGGWGQDNLFEGNTATVNGSGYGFHFTPVNGNVWTCDNTVQVAAAGNSNIPCSTAP